MRGGGKSRRYEAAALALLSEPTVEAAARKAKVALGTLKHWLAYDAEFKAVYQGLRHELVDSALARLQQITLKAVLTLHRLLDCGKPTVELGAASRVLEIAVRDLGLAELTRQVEELKRQVEGAAHGEYGNTEAGSAAPGGPVGTPAEEADAHAGPSAGGPGEPAGPGGTDAGPLATGTTALFP
jgi:hypothetical protein